MDGFQQVWQQGDGVIRLVAGLLLSMSVSAWVVIFWKAWLLRRVRADLGRAVPAFWMASDLAAARLQLSAFDRERVLLPLLDAATAQSAGHTLEAHGQLASQLTRRLRDALHGVLAQLQFGQVLLASIGSTAPFIGLFGTVWGIYHALVGISAAGTITIEKVSGPVGEALVMTAAGLAVAIPAVLAYNIFGKLVGACEAELEGFAHDLRELMGHPASGHTASHPPSGSGPAWGGPALDPGLVGHSASGHTASHPPSGSGPAWGGPAGDPGLVGHPASGRP